MSDYSVFTSESVSEGHPDKMADQISDAVLDAMIAADADSRVACEVLLKDDLIVVAGEYRSCADVDIDALARGVIDDIGYGDPASGYDLASARVLNALGKQSTEIAQGVDETTDHEQGAGDQGLMFGYATAETDVMMPAPITYAHRLMRRHAEGAPGRRRLPAPRREEPVVFPLRPRTASRSPSTRSWSRRTTRPSVDNPTLHEAVMEEIIKPVMPGNWITADTKTFINPAGRFETGGPIADCGLTGRKIIVDTYGGMARHGGGAFSGKDPSKVDRSAAYAGRYVAKNIVAAGTRPALRDPGQLCHRHRGTDLGQRQHLRHRHRFGRADRSTHPCMLRFEATGADRHAEPQTTHLPAHGRLRALRSPGRDLHLGENGQGRGTARGRLTRAEGSPRREGCPARRPGRPSGWYRLDPVGNPHVHT